MDRKEIIQQLSRHLEIERALGVIEMSVSGGTCLSLPDRQAGGRQATLREGASGKKEALERLGREFKQCTLCGLSKSRTQVVFGSGNPEAKLLFVGEAPGFEEDREGQPFVGAAGQLLTKIIVAMKLKREEVYIANCLKCRPPNNRSPLPMEIATCQPILARQIEIIRPRVICALGKFAAQTLLRTQEPIGRLRGRFFDLGGIQVMPTFHPAYLLRNPADKKLVWEDVQKIMKCLST